MGIKMMRGIRSTIECGVPFLSHGKLLWENMKMILAGLWKYKGEWRRNTDGYAGRTY
jgi:hypothetical protein